jgi:hypothetical protein
MGQLGMRATQGIYPFTVDFKPLSLKGLSVPSCDRS